MSDHDAFRIEIAVQAVSHGPNPVAWGRLACLSCDDHVVIRTSTGPPTLGDLDRAADDHAKDCTHPMNHR